MTKLQDFYSEKKVSALDPSTWGQPTPVQATSTRFALVQAETLCRNLGGILDAEYHAAQTFDLKMLGEIIARKNSCREALIQSLAGLKKMAKQDSKIDHDHSLRRAHAQLMEKARRNVTSLGDTLGRVRGFSHYARQYHFIPVDGGRGRRLQ
ncbi:MAG: hypothetical protein MI747_23995 [Desulfobacterales bacterium]|nr:hypothetical protein [Desulfobacterales bacterium]